MTSASQEHGTKQAAAAAGRAPASHATNRSGRPPPRPPAIKVLRRALRTGERRTPIAPRICHREFCDLLADLPDNMRRKLLSAAALTADAALWRTPAGSPLRRRRWRIALRCCSQRPIGHSSQAASGHCTWLRMRSRAMATVSRSRSISSWRLACAGLRPDTASGNASVWVSSRSRSARVGFTCSRWLTAGGLSMPSRPSGGWRSHMSRCRERAASRCHRSRSKCRRRSSHRARCNGGCRHCRRCRGRITVGSVEPMAGCPILRSWSPASSNHACHRRRPSRRPARDGSMRSSTTATG